MRCTGEDRSKACAPEVEAVVSGTELAELDAVGMIRKHHLDYSGVWLDTPQPEPDLQSN